MAGARTGGRGSAAVTAHPAATRRTRYRMGPTPSRPVLHTLEGKVLCRASVAEVAA
jgi:hypothetical protein